MPDTSMHTAQPGSPPCANNDFLQLMWLASPALPIGGFSYSEVLESAIECRGLRGAQDVGAWLLDQLHLVQARGDMAVVARAIAAWRADDLDRIRALNAWVLQTRESSELRLQAEQMGRSMMDWLRHQHPAPSGSPDVELTNAVRPGHVDGSISRSNMAARSSPTSGHEFQSQDPATSRSAATSGDMADRSRICDPPTYPIAFALAASTTAASSADCLHSFAFGWAENMAQAAVKAVPLGQSAGQHILAKLVRAIPHAVAEALARDDESRQAFAPMMSILSARHETQYSRLFRS